MTSFSIIIPLYNKAKSVAKAIDSVLTQIYREYELIIVDDGSTDGSLEIVRSINDSRIRIICKPNGGVCSARNRGIQEATNDYIAFLDADDFWGPEYLLEQKKMIVDFPQASMWGVNWIERGDGQDVSLYTGYPEDFRGYVNDYWRQQRVSDLFLASSVVIKKSSFKKTGTFDERIRYSEDLDMWYRIILNYKVAFNSKQLVIYNQDAENRAMKREIHLKEFLPYYIEKYNSYFATNPDFSHFINTFAASCLLPYYFENRDEFLDAKEAVKHLRYPDIHWKYRLFYQTPLIIGKLFYHQMLKRHSK